MEELIISVSVTQDGMIRIKFNEGQAYLYSYVKGAAETAKKEILARFSNHQEVTN